MGEIGAKRKLTYKIAIKHVYPLIWYYIQTKTTMIIIENMLRIVYNFSCVDFFIQ